MEKLKPGDRIDCRIKASAIVGPYSSYDEIRTFEIVAHDDFGYYAYVPIYLTIKGSVKADSYRCQKLNINKKFLDERIIYIQENMIFNVSHLVDGMACCKCNEFYDMSEPNQDDGTLICWSCRRNPYR